MSIDTQVSSTDRATAALKPLRDSSVEIQVVTSRSDRNAFVRFPWHVYADDPCWVPPLLLERKEFIDSRKHPFYHHGAAQQLLAYRHGKVVGRIQVSDDPRYNAEHEDNVGCFGLFESVDDSRVATALLDAAAAWLVDRGRSRIMGPIDYSTNYSCGLLVDGFQSPARVMMNHNPPYYADLLQAWGLSKVKDMYCWWFDDLHDKLQRWRRKAERIAARGRVTIRPMRRKDFDAEMQRVKTVYHDAWEKNWGFVTMTDAELRHFGKFLSDLGNTEMLLLAEVKGEAAGVALTLPDLNEAIGPLDGRLTRWGLPIGYLKFRAGLSQIKTGRLFALGVTKEFRRRGVAEMLILRALDRAVNLLHYTGAELGWTLEDNQSINSTIETVGGTRYKTYRIFEKTIGRASIASA